MIEFETNLKGLNILKVNDIEVLLTEQDCISLVQQITEKLELRIDG